MNIILKSLRFLLLAIIVLPIWFSLSLAGLFITLILYIFFPKHIITQLMCRNNRKKIIKKFIKHLISIFNYTEIMNEENVRDNRLVLFHEEIMEQERIELSELPDNIQKKIKGFNLLKANYEKNPEERSLLNLRKRAIQLADEIQNYIEEKDENKI